MNNSEILFLYDAKMTNPNGDMDNENKPRMDLDTDTNLVSDVRLKRYVRDYLHDYKGVTLFISNEAEDAKQRGDQIKNNNKKYTECIDVRLFGAVYAAEGGNDHLTGPIQFNWGYSMNKVELQETKTITSSFSSGEGIGKDYRVNYSFIAFSGSLNGKIAEKTDLSDDDLRLFDEAMINSIPANKTRSKTGQTPRLYLRVEMNNNQTFLKDLREYITLDEKIKESRNLRSIKDIQLDIQELKDYLKNNESKINHIHYWQDDQFEIINSEFSKKLKEIKITTENQA